MALDFGKLNAGTAAKQTDPRKIFTTLKRDARFKRPLDEQADVLDTWFERRSAKDLTIKMNTGGGKTVVGLLCLQSSLNENIKPAVYITPDPFLVTQVLEEAQALALQPLQNTQQFCLGRSKLRFDGLPLHSECRITESLCLEFQRRNDAFVFAQVAPEPLLLLRRHRRTAGLEFGLEGRRNVGCSRQARCDQGDTRQRCRDQAAARLH